VTYDEVIYTRVATTFRSGGTFDLQIYCWVCFERIFKVVNIWQSYGEESWLPKRCVRRNSISAKSL